MADEGGTTTLPKTLETAAANLEKVGAGPTADDPAECITDDRIRLQSGVAKEAFKLRAELCERSFAHILDRGGMPRTHPRGRENVRKRFLLHVVGHNLSLLMRQLAGAGIPKETVGRAKGIIFVLTVPNLAFASLLIVVEADQPGFLVIAINGSDAR